MTEKIEIDRSIIADLISKISELDDLSSEDTQEIEATLTSEESLPAELANDEEQEEDPKKKGDIRAQIDRMKLPEKLKIAMFGNATCRQILINNGNRLIQVAVMKNPKIQMKEIEAFSKNPNISKAVIRLISDNRAYMKSYVIKVNMVTNPRTPLDLSIKWLRFLQLADLKKISRSKSVSSAVVTQAKKRLETTKK